MNSTIVVFGEYPAPYPGSTGSIIDRFSFTWPFLLEQKLGRESKAIVRNSLCTSETIARGYQRLKEDCLDLCPDYVVLHFGLTDSRLSIDETPHTTVGDFKNHLTEMVNRARSENMEIVALTPPPLTEQLPDYMSRSLYQRQGVNCVLERYVSAIKDVCSQTTTPVIDLFSLFPRQENWQELLSNGCYPNRAGSRFISDVIADFFADRLKLRRTVADDSLITIVACGDSVTNGIGVKNVVSHSRTWRRIVERRLREHGYRIIVRNAGIPADRTIQAVRRFNADVLTRHPDYVIICLGLNDAWITDAEVPVIPPNLFNKSIGEMLRICRTNNIVPLLLSPNPMTWMYYQDYFQRKIYDQHGVNSQLNLLIDGMRKTAKNENIDFIDIFETFSGHPLWNDHRNELVEDGLHPGPHGHRLWAEKVTHYFMGTLATTRKDGAR